MSHIYAEKKRAAETGRTARPMEDISKSDMLRMSGAGAPQPMSAALREKFEPGFNADFSNIRISRGHIPEEMGIQAVAKGTDILIDSQAGMDVLGHELAHVVQQAQGQVQGGFPVVHNAALEHQADVMGARAASGLSAMEGGMSGFGGGEMMSIAPMSGAEAPAQCKSRAEKKAEKNTNAIAKAAKPVMGSTDALTVKPMIPLSEEKKAQIAGGQAIRNDNQINGNLAPIVGAMNEAKSQYLTGILNNGFDAKHSMSNIKEYRRAHLGKTKYNQDTINATTALFSQMEDYVSTPEYGQMAQEMYRLHSTDAHKEEIKGAGGMDSYILKQLLSKGIGGIPRGVVDYNPNGDNSAWDFIYSGVMTNLGNAEGLRGYIGEEDFPEELKGLVSAYEPLRAKMLAQAKGEALPQAGSAPAQGGWKNADVSDGAYSQAPKQMAGSHRSGLSRLRRKGWY